MKTSLFRSRAQAELFAKTTIGGMTNTSKMPSYSYSTPASACKTGAVLRTQAGSTCASCYACKNRYLFSGVQNAMAGRLATVLGDVHTWEENTVKFLSGVASFVPAKERFFRWHDSGDVQSLAHLRAIVSIAERVPTWRFWLPTKEYAILREFYRLGGRVPENLVIRVSHPMLNQAGSALKLGPSSSVYTTGKPAGSVLCSAPKHGNTCSSCRACWDASVSDVTYRAH